MSYPLFGSCRNANVYENKRFICEMDTCVDVTTC